MNTRFNTRHTKIPGTRIWLAICLASLLLCRSQLPVAHGNQPTTIPGNHFSYTLTEVAQDWITGDQSTGLNQPGGFAGPLDLGFSFRFFGRAYTQAYINSDGFISFEDGAFNPYYRFYTYLPKYTSPNNIIAAMWMPLKFGGGSVVRYGVGGVAPNRYFVIEWVNMIDEQWYGDSVWFEAVLKENGDILLQYYNVPTINYYAVGIEDESGWDGLELAIIVKNASYLLSYPDPAARPRPLPAYQSAFTQAGQSAAFPVEVLNAGDLGNDTFDLTAISGWPVAFFESDGTTPLADSDSDGIPDTSSLAPGASRTIVAKVNIPGGLAPGANTIASLVATSSLNTSIQRTAQLHAIVPASFAQVFTDMGDNAMYLELVEPAQRNRIKAAPDGTDGYESAVAAKPNGDLVYAWGQGEICYTMLDKTGTSLRPPGCLTDLSSEPDYTWESLPALATTPDGKIIVFWMRQYFNYYVSPFTVVANLYFAVLNADGSLAYGPANLTGNTTPTPWNGGGRLFYRGLSLASVGGDRFALAWEQETMPTGSEYVNDIYIAVRSTSGAEIAPPTLLTADTPSSLDGNNDPNLTSLDGGRALLSWYTHGYGYKDTYYAVLDNAGGMVKTTTNLTAGEALEGGYPDAVQITNGKILVAWPLMDGVGYALLNNNYNLDGQVYTMTNPYTTDVNEAVSVTADGAGRGILTWSDHGSSGANGVQRRPFIYYALVDGAGGILTPPAILSDDHDSLDSSLIGYGVAPYTGSAIDVYVQAPSLVGGKPGESTALPIQVGNQGGSAASQVQLTANLDEALTFLSATPAPTSVNGQILTWDLPDLPDGAVQSVLLRVRLPDDAVLGTQYPVGLSVSCSEDDSFTGNNTQTSQVMAAVPVYLPLVRR
jgi:hypothetical protein